MRLWISLLISTLCVLLLMPAGAQGKSKPKPPLPPTRASVTAPSVFEWFSNQHPKAGQRDTVYAELIQGKKGIPGAALMVTVLRGKKVALRVHGTKTDKHGKAHASFVVPKSAGGMSLLVFVSLQQGRQSILGRATLLVAR